MASKFRVKNLAPFPITVLGVSFTKTNQVIDLLTHKTAAEIKNSILYDEMYHKIQGKMICMTTPSEDIDSLGLTDSEYNILTHAGFFQGLMGTDDLKQPTTISTTGALTVSLPQDRYVFTDFSSSVADANDTVDGYTSMDGYSFISLQFIPSGDGTKTLKIYASNEDVTDETTATYTDVTYDYFGSSSFTTEKWMERDTHCSAKWLKFEVAVTGLSGGQTATWKLFMKKTAG